VRDIELRHRQPDLVAIARATHGIELEHASSPVAGPVLFWIKKESTAIARPRDDVAMKRLSRAPQHSNE
jgi:hypothetical protein